MITTKPDWLKVSAPNTQEYQETLELMRNLNLHTVCEEAACPNIAECWKKKCATVLIMGNICTRNCRFCNVHTGKPLPLDKEEPRHIADAVKELGLKHIVITSVDRDELDDGGANHFADCIYAVREASPETTIEILTPDFRGKEGALEIVVASKPTVFNHNVETVPRLHPKIRPMARYFYSLNVLKRVKELDPAIITKSGIMLGLGETKEEVLQVMDDMREADIDFITIGQYLRPTSKQVPVEHYASPEEFEYYQKQAEKRKFKMVQSSPLTRSSYNAGEKIE